MFEKYLAKSDGTTLWDHSCMVYEMSMALLDKAGISDKVIRNAVSFASLFHDIGKTMPVYQEYVRKTPEEQERKPYTDEYPRHNEVSATLFKALKIYPAGRYIENVISAAIRYHHTCTDNDILIGDLYTDKGLKDVSHFVREFCLKYDVGMVNAGLINDRIKEIGEYRVKPSPQFSFLEDDDIDADKIRYLGYYKAIFDIVRYADLIVSSKGQHDLLRPNRGTTDRDFKLPSVYNSDRWEGQKNVVEKLYSLNYSILKATMGYGKTLCGLRFLLKSERLGVWVCPDNSVAQVTYENINRTLEVCGVKGIAVSLLLNGQWIYGSDNADNADIIVTNIDTFENGMFRNSRKEISFKCFFANVIFDEYHEYLMDDNPLSVLFLSAIDVRKKMGNVRTLLMSGTVANGQRFLNFDSEHVIMADDGGMEQKKRIRMRYISPKDITRLFSAKKDYFIVYSAIKNCQDAYREIGDMCLHSRFDSDDMAAKNTKLFSCNGKGHKENETTVISTSTISRAYDLSFSTAVLVNPNPYQILQATGRINRWEYLDRIGELYIVVDEEPMAKGIYLNFEKSRPSQNGAFKKREYTLWDKVYKPYIEEMKKRFPDGEIVTIAKVNDFMDEYFREKNTIRKITETTLLNAFSKLKRIEFRKGTAIDGRNKKEQHTSDKMDVRGENLNRFVCVHIEGEYFGKMSGVMPMPSYAFGSKGFDSLNTSSALSDVMKYFSLNRETAAKYFGVDKLDRKIKHYTKKTGNLHALLMRCALSSETPYPVFGKYTYSHEIGFFGKTTNLNKQF